jgi:hypothetical protein
VTAARPSRRLVAGGLGGASACRPGYYDTPANGSPVPRSWRNRLRELGVAEDRIYPHHPDHYGLITGTTRKRPGLDGAGDQAPGGRGDRRGGVLKGLIGLLDQGGLVLADPAHHRARRRLVDLNQDTAAMIQ